MQLPPGVARVHVDRSGLPLDARGGFEAAWQGPSDDGRQPHDPTPLTLEAFRLRVAEHLRSVAVESGGAAPGAVIVNLASHQLVDDVRGWAVLNQDAMRPKP